MDAAFLERLKAAFRIEAEEHLQALSSGLLELERGFSASGGAAQAGDFASLIETIFREAHSLKGAARAVNFDDIETLCQALEDVFARWKADARSAASTSFDALHAALDAMNQILVGESAPFTQTQLRALARAVQEETTDTASSTPPPSPTPTPTSNRIENDRPSTPAHTPSELSISPLPAPAPLVGPAPSITSPPAPEPEPVASPVAASPVAAETIRIATGKLDTLLLQAEELVALKMTSGQRVLDLRALESQLEAWRKEWNVATEQMSTLLTPGQAALLRELWETQRSRLHLFAGKISALAKLSERDHYATNGLVDNLLEDTKKLLMQPFSVGLAIFPKLVRDLAREQDKEIDFVMRGTDVEIDKRILEEMKAPLTHLIRNAIDHGLETADARARSGKRRGGSLELNVTQSGGKVEIEIRDDGKGIDSLQVKRSAVRNGVLGEDAAENLSDDEALQLIFRSAVSTSPIVTELSGRGLGMAIVREKVSALGGEIAIETQIGRGTTFRISLPLTLATFRGLLVREAGQLFILPTLAVTRVLRVRKDEIKTVEGADTIPCGDEILALVALRAVLGISGPSTPAAQESDVFVHVAVLENGGERVAFRLDEIGNEQEVLVKSFEKPLQRVRHISGASVLGTGQVAPVLNVADLIASATRGAFSATTSAAPIAETQSAWRILVADDSITSRMLIKNILEAAGYQVQTAVDGQDALTELRARDFDLVVSDVDMPRLDGFGLTAQVRANERLKNLPVVLVTGRETHEDREKGIDAGANAYIVKSSFDQSNLLDVISRLL